MARCARPEGTWALGWLTFPLRVPVGAVLFAICQSRRRGASKNSLDRASLPEEVRQVADALLKLLETAPDVPTHVRIGVRVACLSRQWVRSPSETRLTVALVGDTWSRPTHVH